MKTLTALCLRSVLLLAMALPMLVLYATSTLGVLLSRDLHFKPELLGYLISSSFGVAAVLSLWAGAVVDKLGSRYGLMLLFFSIASAFGVMVSVQSFYGLLVAVGICGIAQALANPVTNLLIAQNVPPPQRAGVVGLKQSGVQVAALFAGLALPSLALHQGWRFALGMIIPVALLLLISTPLITPKLHQPSGQRLRLTLPNGLLARLMSIQFCVGISLSAFVTFLPTFAVQQAMPIALAGSLIAVFGAMGIVSRIVLTPLGAKLRDEAWLLLVLIMIAALGMLLTVQANPTRHYLLWVGAITVGLTAVGTNAIAMSMLLRDSAFGVVTVASGLVSVAFFGGFALGPALYGQLVVYSTEISWAVLIAVLLVGCLMTISLALARHKPSHEALVLQAEIKLLKNRIEQLEQNHAVLLQHLTDNKPLIPKPTNVVSLTVAAKNKARPRKKRKA